MISFDSLARHAVSPDAQASVGLVPPPALGEGVRGRGFRARKQSLPPNPPPLKGRGEEEKRRAAATTELVLLLPFLTLAFLVVLDFGRIYYVTQTLEASVAAGAAYAGGSAQTTSATGSTLAAVNAVCAGGVSLNPPLNSSNVTVTQNSSAGTATVTVTYTFQTLTPIYNASQQVQLTRSLTVPMAPVPGS
jgi:TadE-like protein